MKYPLYFVAYQDDDGSYTMTHEYFQDQEIAQEYARSIASGRQPIVVTQHKDMRPVGTSKVFSAKKKVFKADEAWVYALSRKEFKQDA